jgi:fumarate reductase flavoprotein subunit
MSSDQLKGNSDLKANLVIIGGGGAGLAAAVAAAEKGISNIIVLEKLGHTGGNSALAFGIFAAESPVQKRAKLVANRDDLFRKAMDHAHWRTNPLIVRTFINKSGNTIQWLEEKGLEFDVCPLYPGQVSPTMHCPAGMGAHLIKVLKQNCEDLEVKILASTPAKKILKDGKQHKRENQCSIGTQIKNRKRTSQARLKPVRFKSNPG